MSMRLSAFVLVLFCAAAVACGNTAPPAQEAQQVVSEVVPEAPPSNPLVGTWSVWTIAPGDGSPVIDPAQPSLAIFGPDGYYSMVYTVGPDPRAHSATPFEPTDEEKVAQWDSMIVNTGRYDVSGSTLTTRPLMAKVPEFTGGYATNAFVIDEEALTLTLTELVSVDGTPSAGPMGEVLTLRRMPRSVISVAIGRALAPQAGEHPTSLMAAAPAD